MKESLLLMEEVMALHESRLGPDHPETLRSMRNLALDFREAGRRDEALKVIEEVVIKCKSKLGPDDPDTLKSERFLAYLSQKPNEPAPLDKAPTSVDEALNISKQPRLKLLRWLRSNKK